MSELAPSRTATEPSQQQFSYIQLFKYVSSTAKTAPGRCSAGLKTRTVFCPFLHRHGTQGKSIGRTGRLVLPLHIPGLFGPRKNTSRDSFLMEGEGSDGGTAWANRSRRDSADATFIRTVRGAADASTGLVPTVGDVAATGDTARLKREKDLHDSKVAGLDAFGRLVSDESKTLNGMDRFSRRCDQCTPIAHETANWST